MPKLYKAPNKRLIPRSKDGRFRETTMADLGLGCPICPECGGFNPYERHVIKNGFVTLADPPTHCHKCDAELKE